jgi:hypothetical protein
MVADPAASVDPFGRQVMKKAAHLGERPFILSD